MNIAIAGCGVMGIGIAATAVGYGIDVTMTDIDDNVLRSAEARLNRALRHGQLMTAFPKQGARGKIRIAESIKSISNCSPIIEAVTEDTPVKIDLLRKLQEIVLRDTPIITNTSGIPIDALAADLPRPQELIGVHFMNPAYLIRTVELTQGRRTSHAVLLATTQFLHSMERTAIIVRDSPGFVTSRLLHSMINDAAALVGEQVATPEEVDLLMQGCLGHPTGPLKTADLIGIDNLVDSLTTLFEQTNDLRYKPSETLLDLVANGRLGQKSGRGFYEY